MKHRIPILATLALAIGVISVAAARGGGGGGGARPSVSRPSAPVSRPSLSQPSVSRPSASVSRPSVNLPQSRPSPAPGRPAIDRPNIGGGVSRPDINRPTTLPGINKPITKPETKPAQRPGGATTLPGNAGSKPGGGFIPIPSENRPGGSNRPIDPGFNRPGTAWRPQRPDGKPGRPDPGDTFINNGNINVGNNFNNHFNSLQGGSKAWINHRENYWNDWSGRHSERLNNFCDHRQDRWDHIRDFRENRWDDWRDRRGDWLGWRNDVWDFRRDRADEIRDCIRDSNSHWFTPNWWLGARWWPGVTINVNLNPWWWWRAVTWPRYEIIYWGAPPEPITYDYGTDIIIQDEQVYIEGKNVGSAPDYRAEAIALGHPARDPAPPVPESEDDRTIIPLGVWALVQEQQGDAVMFFQLSATKDGLITGAYSNVLTGDSQPVTGAIDKKTQRVAFHIGANDNTAIEANLNGLTKDQLVAFVHYGTGKTQEWLLVRLSNPDMPDLPQALPAPR